MTWPWLAFLALVAGLLALDLGLFHRRPRAVGLGESLGWSAAWVALALAFAAFVFLAYRGHWGGLGTGLDRIDGRANGGRGAAIKFLTSYALEESLSVDNLLVISLLLVSFGVPAAHRHRVLFWGVIGAVALRGAMIGLGVEIIAHFRWVLDVFGVFLVATAVHMLRGGGRPADPAGGRLVRLATRLLPATGELHGGRLIVAAPRGPGRKIAWVLTPLAVALVAVEAADVLFAVDSIPAIFAVTADPFLVFTSNILAILGVRSLYFVLEGLVGRFRGLRPALAVILAVVGAKMLLGDWLARNAGPDLDAWLLGLVVAILAAGMLASRLTEDRRKR
jgi:TerC family integral membrane protein